MKSILKYLSLTRVAASQLPPGLYEKYFLATHLRRRRTYAVDKKDEQRFLSASREELFVCYRIRENVDVKTPMYFSRAELEHHTLLEATDIPRLFS